MNSASRPVMSYRVPRPVVSPEDLQLLIEQHRLGGVALPRPVTMTVGGVAAGIGPTPSGEIERVRWWYGSDSGLAIRASIAMQIIVARAVLASPPAPLYLNDLEIAQLRRAADERDRCADELRKVLRWRTGFDWSVRVGRGKASESISISSKPVSLVDGKMSLLDAALLAALSGRDFVNPVCGVTVGGSRSDRIEILAAISGCQILVKAVAQ